MRKEDIIKTLKATDSTVLSFPMCYNFAPIVHEYIMVLKKASDLFIDFQLPTKHELDIRNSRSATWADVVSAVLSSLGGKASLSQIYEKIAGHKKCETNNNWQAKVRQTLQMHNYFNRVSEGVWAIDTNRLCAA